MALYKYDYDYYYFFDYYTMCLHSFYDCVNPALNDHSLNSHGNMVILCKQCGFTELLKL